VPGHWLRLNGDIYQSDYHNKQIVLSNPALGGLAPTYVNIPSSRIKGSSSKPIWRRARASASMPRSG
jgi:hypothetical protein